MSLRDTRAANEMPSGEAVAGFAAGRAMVQAKRENGGSMRFPDHASYIRYKQAVARIQLRQQFRVAQAAAVIEATITTPNAPTGLGVIPKDSSVSIEFTAPTSDGGAPITNYQYSLNNGSTWSSFSPAIISSPVTITSLDNGIVYQIKLRAVNRKGAGEASSSVSVAPIPSTFTPRSITESKVWLDGICSETVLLTSGKVSTWNDKSTASVPNNFTVSAPGQNITYVTSSGINNRPAVYFTSTGLSLKRTANISASNNLSVFMVVQQINDPSGGNSELFVVSADPNNSSDTNPYKYFDLFSETNPGGAGTLQLNLGGTENDTSVDIITTPPISFVISVVISSTGNVFINGNSTPVSGALRGSAPYNNLNKILTWALSTAQFVGYIGEVVTYNKALNSTERQKIEGYLAWKWGLQGSLPSGHPYSSSPPAS